jgi:type VI protein secretion system component VasK
MHMLLGELRRRNRDFLALHARFMEQNDDLLNIVAAAVDKKDMTTNWDALDLVRCAIASYAYIDLGEGAEHFFDLMSHNATWAEKMDLVREALRETTTEQ